MNILVIDDQPERAVVLERALTDIGHQVVVRPPGRNSLHQLVLSFSPDVVIVDAQSPDRDMLEDVALASDRTPRPIIFFAEDDDSDVIRRSIEAGVSAYVVDGLKPERVNTIIKVAISRFNAHQSLRGELEKTRSELADRKLIERAKGLLMQHRQCTEAEAFGAMRSMAMKKKVRLSEVAQDVLSLFET